VFSIFCENQSNSKEVRQLEQKLRKKEEQLKIKEAILNENTNDRTRLLDRLYQAEPRNLELEQTLKTLNQKIENTGQKDLDFGELIFCCCGQLTLNSCNLFSS
jgi:chromosome segregation ATPase